MFEQSKNNPHEYILGDYSDELYFPLLMELPKELAQIHIGKIEDARLTPDQAVSYMIGILRERKEAMTETQISDTHLQDVLTTKDSQREMMEKIDTTVFKSETIGSGQTAKIKRFEFTDGDSIIPMAIKYLLTPTAKTLSATAEHDMLCEVERMRQIEDIEAQTNVKRIQVPHPYFHHKNEHLQCYGMKLIDGADLRQIIEGEASENLFTELRAVFKDVDLNDIFAEFDTFFTQMHTYCLHGDIKPANIMVDRDGIFYVIDFGQSILVGDIYENAREQLDNLKEDEIEQSKIAVKMFLKAILSHSPQK